MFLLAGFHDRKEQVVCVFILDINTTASVLTTWNKTIQRERGEKSMHLTYKISGNDSCIVTLDTTVYYVAGEYSLLNPTYIDPL